VAEAATRLYMTMDECFVYPEYDAFSLSFRAADTFKPYIA